MLMRSLKVIIPGLCFLSCLGLFLVEPSSSATILVAQRSENTANTELAHEKIAPAPEMTLREKQVRKPAQTMTKRAPQKAQKVTQNVSTPAPERKVRKKQMRKPTKKVTKRVQPRPQKVARKTQAKARKSKKRPVMKPKKTKIVKRPQKTQIIRTIKRKAPRTKASAKFAQKLSETKRDKATSSDSCTQIDDMKKDVSCVIKRLQTKYASIKSMTANFKQTYTYAVYQRKQTSRGKMFLKSPGRMRWDYQAPSAKVFVADGSNLWVYEPDKNQAYQRSLAESELPIAIRFLMGEGNLLKEFKPAFKEANNTTVTVLLTPRKATTKYKRLTMVINRADFMVKETTITDPVNNTNRVQFLNTKLNVKLPDAGFKFVPPKGVNIVR